MSDYTPVVDDYVKWKDMLKDGCITKGMNTSRLRLVSRINQSVSTPKNEKHKKVHCLVVCQTWFWDELEYVKNRREDLHIILNISHRSGRYLDIQ